MNSRLAQLDLLRLGSVALVMFGHFVMVGGGATRIDLIIADGVPLPLVDASTWGLWRFEVFLIQTFKTQAAVLGVTLFFIITGYLMPMMLERYTRTGFLINRCARIFPVLVVGTAAIGLFLWISQGLTFSVSSYFGSWTLAYEVAQVAPVTSVLWSLVVEVIFYFGAFLLGRFTIHRLLFAQTILLAAILIYVKFPGSLYAMLGARYASYMLLILIGSAIFLAEREKPWGRKAALVLSAILAAHIGFQLSGIAKANTSTYGNLGTPLLAASLFIGFQYLAATKWLSKPPVLLTKLADLVYPIYILHASIGLATMAVIRQWSPNPYSMLLAAVAVTLVLSALVHALVEKPGISVGRSLVRRLEGKPAA
jgi:peptidoglycan/LPS O-acetylase OafA/YrhL